MKSPKVTLKKIEQEIDLSEFFPGVDFSQERALKEAIGQAIIDKIASRTEAGEGIKFSASGQGRSVSLHSPYSKEYSESLDFKAAGKKRTKINMTLTGDMLAGVDLEIGSSGKFKVVVAEDQVPKAYNHIVGDTVPQRPWFGVSKSELKEILKDFRADVKFAKEQPGETDKVDGNAQRIKALDLLGESDDEE